MAISFRTLVPLAAAALTLAVCTTHSWGQPPTLRGELEELEADRPVSEAARDPLRRAREALAQADQIRSQQPKHAQLADSVVQEWVHVTQDLKRAIVAERRATALEQETARLRRQIQNERILLEESGVDKQRLEGVVQQLEAEESLRLGQPPSAGRREEP